jgi:hypothetical protein
MINWSGKPLIALVSPNQLINHLIDRSPAHWPKEPPTWSTMAVFVVIIRFLDAGPGCAYLGELDGFVWLIMIDWSGRWSTGFPMVDQWNRSRPNSSDQPHCFVQENCVVQPWRCERQTPWSTDHGWKLINFVINWSSAKSEQTLFCRFEIFCSGIWRSIDQRRFRDQCNSLWTMGLFAKRNTCPDKSNSTTWQAFQGSDQRVIIWPIKGIGGLINGNNSLGHDANSFGREKNRLITGFRIRLIRQQLCRSALINRSFYIWQKRLPRDQWISLPDQRICPDSADERQNSLSLNNRSQSRRDPLKRLHFGRTNGEFSIGQGWSSDHPWIDHVNSRPWSIGHMRSIDQFSEQLPALMHGTAGLLQVKRWNRPRQTILSSPPVAFSTP